jgi:hypothetical protein
VDGIEATGKKGKSVNNHITYSSSTTRSVVTSQIRAGDNRQGKDNTGWQHVLA